MHSPFLERPTGPLPSEQDFDPHGADAPAEAWRCFGKLSLRDAYRHFLTDPEGLEEKFAYMGEKAFDYYFPVLDRFVRGADPKDPADHREAEAIGYTIAAQMMTAEEPRLREEVAALAEHVLANLKQYSPHKKGQKKVAGAWELVEKRLANR